MIHVTIYLLIENLITVLLYISMKKNIYKKVKCLERGKKDYKCIMIGHLS